MEEADRMVNEQEGCEWMMFLLVPAHPGRPGQSAIKQSCVCVCRFRAIRVRVNKVTTVGLEIGLGSG